MSSSAVSSTKDRHASGDSEAAAETAHIEELVVWAEVERTSVSRPPLTVSAAGGDEARRQPACQSDYLARAFSEGGAS